MAFQKVINRAVRGPGMFRSPQRTLQAGTRITVRLDAVWDNVSDMCLFGLEQLLEDGVTWYHFISAPAYGGDRGKAGALPSITSGLQEADKLVRLILLLPQSMEIGLEIEINNT